MTSSLKRAVLWDMDGVIVDSAVYHMRSWQETWARIGITFTAADFRRSFGMRNDEIIRAVLGKDFTQQKFEKIVEAKESAFRRLIKDHIQALPGVVDLFKALDNEGYLQALVTSTPLENIDLIIGKLKIYRYFKTVVSGYDVTEGKPSPQGYLLAAKRLDVIPAMCVVIEDAIACVQAAGNGGMKCIAVTNTHPKVKLKAADVVVDSLEKISIADVEKILGLGIKRKTRKGVSND